MGKSPKKKKPKRKPSAYNKHVGREMRAGKTMKQAAASWKKKGSKSSRASPKKRSNPTGGTRNMTKNSFNMNKIYSLANKVAFFAPYAGIAMDPALDMGAKINRGIAYLTGWIPRENRWSWEHLKQGWTPYVATKIMTAVVPKISRFVKGLLG